MVGIPDDRWGEVGIAAVVVAPGASAGEDELIAHCRARLAGYKVPKAIRSWTSCRAARWARC